MPKNKKKKILVITGTRAEYGLLRPIIKRIQESSKVSSDLLVTGMHTLRKFGYTIDVIKNDKIPISCIVKILESDSMLSSFSKEIRGMEQYCLKTKPDLILILGDRDEPLAGAIVGSHLGVPVAHVHGGDVSGSHTVDELIRHAITKLSHLHFTASQKSYLRVIKLGEETKRVFKVGAPGLDELNDVKYLNREELALKLNLNPSKKWILLVQHPVYLDKVSVNSQIGETLKAIEELDCKKVIIYPNSDKGSDIIIREIEKLRGKAGYYIFKNFERHLYINILKNFDLMIGNSSSGIIETGFFKLPTVDIGTRQMGRERGRNVLNADYNSQNILKKISTALSPYFRKSIKNMTHPYGDGTASKKIVEILEKIIDDPALILKGFTYVKI